ncbi:anticodon-binding protein [Coprinopsis sp. MPI-PUGE-AT-0042]|nr:anticodon-binding protein [Coprinopsis sp. MPI-PUGE-AT-0042]
MFNVFVEDPVDKSNLHHVWQNLWGLSTMAIGVMVHGDNQGLVLPPRVASVQAVIVPCGITAKSRDEPRVNFNNACEELAQTLRKAGVKAKADLWDGYTLGYELNDWEQNGVPLHLEIRLDYLAKKRALTVRRDTGVKNRAPLDNIGSTISSILETIQTDTLTTVKQTYRERVTITEWNDAIPALDAKNVIVIPW